MVLEALRERLVSILRPDQRAILAHPAKRKTIANGRRWGKTVLGGVAAFLCAMSGGAVAWVAPTYKNTRPLWRFAMGLVAIMGRAGYRIEPRISDRTLSFPGGGFIGVYTGDSPDSMRGEAFDLVVVDEAAFIVADFVSRIVTPTLADRDGALILISTPADLNWFYHEWLRGRGDGREDGYMSWVAKSNANPSPHIQRAYELARERLDEVTFRREWKAEFLSDDGVVFRYVDERGLLAPAQPEPGHTYVMGIDLARTVDYTVVVVLDATETPARQVHLERWNRIDWQMQLDRIVAAIATYRPSMVAVDRTGIGDMPVAELTERVPDTSIWGVAFNAGNKASMVRALAAAIERGDIELLDHAIQAGELKAYEAKSRPSGTVAYGAPAGQHDDIVSALMLAWDIAKPALSGAGVMLDLSVA